jgi:hypothetical protein
MMKEIQSTVLPKTFYDAITATREIGERYIWIDSLCIIQDDPNDWQKESALMGLVYSRSYCNLSATASDGSEKGLFFPRTIASMSSVKPYKVSHDRREAEMVLYVVPRVLGRGG